MVRYGDDRPGWIYCAQSDTVGSPIKIGYSMRSCKHRLSDFQPGNPEKLRLTRQIRIDADPRGEEGRIHKRFAEYHIRGDWFRAAPPVAEFANATSHAIKDS